MPLPPHNKSGDRLHERLVSRMASLSPGLRSVLTYISENRDLILSQSALEIAAHTGTSDATVIRAIQALGFDGLRELKAELRRSRAETLSSDEKMIVTTQSLSTDINAAIDYVIESHMEATRQLATDDNRASIISAIDILKGANRIGVFGIGASAVLTDYAVRMFCRNGCPSYPLNRTGIALGEQILAMQRGDALIMMAQSSPHREGETVINEAIRLKIPTVLVTASPAGGFRDKASVIVTAPRGRADRVPLHGAILMCLETIILGFATAAPDRSTGSLKRLNQFYSSLRKKSRNV